MPTEDDLEIRAALAQSPTLRVVSLAGMIVDRDLQFSREEIEAFVHCFMLCPLSGEPVKMAKKPAAKSVSASM